MKRRAVLLGGVAGALGLGAVLRPGDKGRNHQRYFRDVSAALDHCRCGIGCLRARTPRG